MRISDSAMKEHLDIVKKDLHDKETEVRDMSVQIATKNNLIEQLQKQIASEKENCRQQQKKASDSRIKYQKYKDQVERLKIELTVTTEKYKLQMAEYGKVVERLDEAERARSQQSSDVAKFRVENEDLRRQLEQLNNIKVDPGIIAADGRNLLGSAGDSSKRCMERFGFFKEQLEMLKDELNQEPVASTGFSETIMNTRQPTTGHSRHGSDAGSTKNFIFPSTT